MINEEQHWTLDKRIPLSLIFIMVVYLIAGIWSYSTLMSTVIHNNEMMIIATKSLDSKLTEKTISLLKSVEHNQQLMLNSTEDLEDKLVVRTEDRFHKTEALEHIRVLQIQIENNSKENMETNRRLEKCTENINTKLDRLIDKSLEYHSK